jgi:Ca2+-binding RTX toxin-like protein
MTTIFKLKPFRFNGTDLNFLREQVNFRPLFDVDGNAIIAWDGTTAIYTANHAPIFDPTLVGTHVVTTAEATANIQTYGTSYSSVTASEGLRDVTGFNNNLNLANSLWGSVDQPFFRSVPADYSNYLQPSTTGFYGSQTFGTTSTGPIDYTITGTQAGTSIVDYTPRMISRTITTGGATPLQDADGQVLHWYAARYDQSSTSYDAGYAATLDTALGAAGLTTAGLIDGAAIVRDVGIFVSGQHDPQDPTNGELFFGAVNPGVAPGNSWLAYFGQFFDHGLDFIDKGAAGTKITIPLAVGDPLYRAPGTNGPDDRGNTKITVSRANVSGFDAAGNPEYINHTSPYIDQSQTYGSHDQMTALLRRWVSTDGDSTYHAGAELFDGDTSVAWTNAWGEMVNSTLPTLNELRAHLVATGRADLTWEDVSNLRNRDASGQVADSDASQAGIQSTGSGQALLLDMNPNFDTAHFSAATETALTSLGIIADVNGKYALGGPPGSLTLGNLIDFRTFQPQAGADALLVSNILLEAVGDHYIAGDGRVNENIGLTAIHHVFHEEHNYQVRNIQEAILAQDARAVVLGDNSHTFAHDWQFDAGFGQDVNGNYLLAATVPAITDPNYRNFIAWDAEKIFTAAKLTVEMEYQHVAVDQYARTITPDLPEFVGYNSGENATVSLEYAQGAFRFGHSTIRETINTMDPNGSITGKVMSIALEQAFLNPGKFAATGAAAIALGMTHQQMNEIDELITPALNQGLLGQPLDLAAINIARGRDIGLPTLNDFRAGVGLTRYVSWADFGANMVHPESLVNFIAAYSFDGDVVGLENGAIAEGTPAAEGYSVGDSIAFLNGGDTGYNRIDTWIGGLAEVHVMGGLLGETFNLVFVDQINRLMDGDRFYYLYRLNNLNLGDEIANAQFKDIIERNTGLEHLNGSAFAYADQYVDLSAKVDTVNNADTGNFKNDHKYGEVLVKNTSTTLVPNYVVAAVGDTAAINAVDPINGAKLGVYTTSGNSTASNGSIITVGGVQYIRDIRAVNLALPNVGDGFALDGTQTTGANAHEVLIGTDNADLIYMWAGDDTAYGEGGNDIIYGGAGIDRLYGGDGNDTIYGGDSGDLIDGGAGDDILYGESSGSAAAGVDQVIGGDGNDIIYGGVGIDKLSGGAGDDVIFGGQDTDAFTHGGDGNDYIDGGSDGDLLWGDGGDDLIVGGNNQDIVAGLDGDDILRPGNPSSAAGGGPDEVLGGDGKSDLGNEGRGIGFDLIDFSDYVVSPTGVTADFATQQNPLVAIDGTTPFPAWVGIEGVIGSRNNDTVLADANNNWLFGGSGNDTLMGGGGNDVIIGDGIRLDSLIGTYSGGYGNVFDTATHRAVGFIGTNGLLDAVGMGNQKHFTEMLKSEMFSNLELGGSAIKALQVTNAAGVLVNVADTRVGDGGAAGTDTVVFTGNRLDYTVEKITFVTAKEGPIVAYKIIDSVAGRDGTDIVSGVENFRFADLTATTESQLLNVAPVITSGGGGATAALAVDENSTAVMTITATDANNVLGNPLNPQTLTYSISGGVDAGMFTINGTTGELSFAANPNFEAPADVGTNNVYDVIIRVSDGLVFDEQALAVTVNNVDEAGVGGVNITGAYARVGNTVTINASNNITDPDGVLAVAYQWEQFDGNANAWAAVANIVQQVTFTGGTSSVLSITPGGNNQQVQQLRVTASYTDGPFGQKAVAPSSETAFIGTTGSNVIDGTTGVDLMLGFGGSDTFRASLGNDIVDGGTGTDTYDLSLTQAGATINLTSGAAASAATGSDTLFSIENVIGSSGDDQITDGAGANNLAGGVGNDTFNLTNDNARDTINGGNGNRDTISYATFTAGLTVTLGNNGAQTTVGGSGTNNNTDQISNIEDVVGGSGNDRITGNNLANILMGGVGADVLNGGNGADTLTGGVGADTFVFNTAFANGVFDTITDFDHLIDRIHLDNAQGLFGTALGGNGALVGTAFTSNANSNLAQDASDRIIYNQDNGWLSYDADGTGTVASFHFATLQPNLTVTSADFLVI